MQPWRWQHLEVWCLQKKPSWRPVNSVLFRHEASVQGVSLPFFLCLSLNTDIHLAAALFAGLMVCAVAVDLRLKHRIDKYVAWGLSIVGGWELHFEAAYGIGSLMVSFKWEVSRVGVQKTFVFPSKIL